MSYELKIVLSVGGVCVIGFGIMLFAEYGRSRGWWR